ncbi:hypothetical protein AB9F47_30490 [Rhizobium leguminosarum]|uniref:hypothetical protein n=1 Tax=Rhizobium leguminosarum TaxID=384 RepID=UPI003F9DAA71
MRDSDNANAREDDSLSPAPVNASEKTTANEVDIADKGQVAEVTPVAEEIESESPVSAEIVNEQSSVAERPKYMFWITILLLAGALSAFSFATGSGNPARSSVSQSGWLSVWQNTPNFKFLVTFFLIAACLVLTVSSRDFASTWTNVRRVLESGVFYFFAGLGLILYAKQGTDAAEHPSITFILAMLGVAIMLFGTGSQAAGAIATMGSNLPALPNKDGPVVAAEEPVGTNDSPMKDWTPLKANAVIAGGAAVLTAIFGFGVIHYADDIPGVFRDYSGYNRVMIRPCLAAAPGSCTETDISTFMEAKNLSLTDYSVSAENADGRELFIRKEDKTIQILALKDEMRSGSYISLRFDRIRDAPLGTLLASSISVDVPIAASNDDVSASGCDRGSGHGATRCRLSKTANASFNRDDNTSLVTFTLDFSGGVKSDSLSVQTTHFDPMLNAVKPVTIELQ